MRVVATGTFDIIHPGHVRFLKEAKKLGSELIVIVAREKNVRHKLKPIIPEEQRRRVVESLKYVDRAVRGDLEDMFKPIVELKPDIIALGHDQHFDEKWLTEELRKRGLKTKVVRIRAEEECEYCSSTKIIRRVAELAKKRVEEYEKMKLEKIKKQVLAKSGGGKSES
jgi:FAD synthetase